MTTLKQALEQATELLQGHSPSAALDAEILLCHCMEKPRSHLRAWPEKHLKPAEATSFSQLLQQRLAGQPIAYLTGKREFWSMPLQVNPHTLIPRPETELLVELILQRGDASKALRIADLGTGSGAIALALASERPNWHLTATDISEAALQRAQTNAEQNDIRNIEFRLGRWFEAIAGLSFDIIASNPPYIAEDDPHLTQGDVRFEPRSALTAGRDGLDDIRQLIAQAHGFLIPGGWLVLEHGYNQKRSVEALFNSEGYKELIQLDDYSGQPRLCAAQAPS